MADVPAVGDADRIGDRASDHADRLAIRAEQALLGTVMSDPGQAAVLDLVRAGDMLRPYHGQVLAAVQRLRGRGAAPEPVAVRAELAADPDLPPSVSRDGVLLIELLEAAPRPGMRPPTPPWSSSRGSGRTWRWPRRGLSRRRRQASWTVRCAWSHGPAASFATARHGGRNCRR